MKALVTGGAGFIGSHIIEGLLREKAEVRVLDDFSTGNKANIPVSAQVEVVHGRLNDRELLATAVKGIDCIFHEAAITSVSYSIKHPAATWETNIKGTKLLLNAAVGSGVKRVVFASSAAVYGNALPPLKESRDAKPISPYGNSKRMGEMLMSEYHEKEGLETLSLRYFNVYGPRQNPSSNYSGVITKFIRRMAKGELPVIYGNGMQTRDFVFVKDVAHANLLAAGIKKAEGDIYNVATGASVSILDLLREFNLILGKELQPVFEKEMVGDIRFSFADVSLAEKKLEFRAETGLRQGLEKTVEWYMDFGLKTGG